MGTKHTAIVRQVLIDWTASDRGTLWQNNQINVPLGDGKKWVRAGLGDGTADIIGIEVKAYLGFDDEVYEYGAFTAIEVKTRGDWLRKRQVDHLSVVSDFAGHYYLALEMPGCTVEAPEYRLYRVDSAERLAEVRHEWNVAWSEAECNS